MNFGVNLMQLSYSDILPLSKIIFSFFVCPYKIEKMSYKNFGVSVKTEFFEFTVLLE